MTQSTSLHIDLSGIRFKLTVDDVRLLPLLERLWWPFVAAPDTSESTDVRLCVSDGALPFYQFEREEPGYCGDLWSMLFGARLQMTMRALEVATDHYVYLHSGVLERDGEAVLLCGPFDSGKTTLSIELLTRGWRLLSDDVALIDPITLEIHWFPKPLGIKRGNWDYYKRFWHPFPEWLPRPAHGFLLPATAFPLSRKVARIGTMTFLEYDAGVPFDIEKISPARAAVLASQATTGLTAESLRTLSALADQAGCIFQVTHSGDHAAVEGLLGVLGGI